MTKRNIGDEIIKGMEEAIGYMRGKKTRAAIHKVEIPNEFDVRAIREKLKLSRQKFADCFGFSARTLQHWEQGDRYPHGSARVLLLLLQREPTMIAGILRHTKKDRSKRQHRKEAT
ncbi:MAG TPA: transcriptional regulator [Gammaproteobacteria bacterium]|nr:transcriptional regulator [Gammaproteobacteria bacterium]